MHEGRHFRILCILLNNEQVIAPGLAEEFGVSIRTIYRDIDTMSVAGIPIYMQGGCKGGIYFLEGYRLDKVTLSKTEQAEILLALQRLGVVQYPDIDPVLLKLGTLSMSQDRDWINVDLTRWGIAEMAHRDKELFLIFRKAITGLWRTHFEYYGVKGEMTVRIAKSVKPIYRRRAWYLAGYCLTKQEPHVFRLPRMKKTGLTEELFEYPPEKEAPYFTLDGNYGSLLNVRLMSNKPVAYCLYDVFEDDIMIRQDDNIIVETQLPDFEQLYSFLLSFGGNVTILEPENLRQAVKERVLQASPIIQNSCILRLIAVICKEKTNDAFKHQGMIYGQKKTYQSEH